MLRHGNIVGSGGNNIVGSHPCICTVAGFPVGIDHFAVLVVCKANGSVIAPIPVFIGDGGFFLAICVNDLQLGKQLGFLTVLVPDSPRTATATVPPVSQLNS